LSYIPGEDQHKIENSLTLGAGCIDTVMDDGVALNQKTKICQKRVKKP
jgi:hypothetical protein